MQDNHQDTRRPPILLSLLTQVTQSRPLPITNSNNAYYVTNISSNYFPLESFCCFYRESELCANIITVSMSSQVDSSTVVDSSEYGIITDRRPEEKENPSKAVLQWEIHSMMVTSDR